MWENFYPPWTIYLNNLSLPENNCHNEGKGREDIYNGWCKCCWCVLHSQVVQILIQHWPVNPKPIKIHISIFLLIFNFHAPPIARGLLFGWPKTRSFKKKIFMERKEIWAWDNNMWKHIHVSLYFLKTRYLTHWTDGPFKVNVKFCISYLNT